MTTPVLEWRIADAAQKLLQDCLALGQTLPEGDDLTADNTRKWAYATSVGALVVTDLKGKDGDEVIMRAEGIVTGAVAIMHEELVTPEQRKAFGMWLVTQGLALAKAP